MEYIMRTVSRNNKTHLDNIISRYDFGSFSIGLNKPNQDNYICMFSKDKFLLAVADGIGGLPHGNIASQIAIDCLSKINLDKYLSKDSIPNKFHEIREKLEKIKKNMKLEREIGTTLTVAYINDKTVNVFHTGDSRLYIYENKNILFETTDQSISKEYWSGMCSNIITSAVISNREIEIEEKTIKRNFLGSVVLVTDGVYKALDKGQFEYLHKICESENKFSETIKSYLEIRGVDDDSTMISLTLRN
jgi:protein phosphatase